MSSEKNKDTHPEKDSFDCDAPEPCNCAHCVSLFPLLASDLPLDSDPDKDPDETIFFK